MPEDMKLNGVYLLYYILKLVIENLLPIAASVAATYYAKSQNAKTKQIETDTERKELESAIEDVEELTEKAVAAAEQVTCKELREKVRAGQAKREELEGVGKEVLTEITEALKPEVQQIIRDHFGSFTAYVSKCIDNQLLKIKEQKAGGENCG